MLIGVAYTQLSIGLSFCYKNMFATLLTTHSVNLLHGSSRVMLAHLDFRAGQALKVRRACLVILDPEEHEERKDRG